MSASVLFNSSCGFEAYLESHGLESRVLARLPMDHQLLSICVNGEAPTIMITAGSHADEIAGVFASVELLIRMVKGELAVPNRVVFVPLRDPIGWDGFNHALASVTGRHLDIMCHDEAKSLLTSLPTATCHESGRLFIATVNDLAFCSIPRTRYRSSVISRQLLASAVEQDATARNMLIGKRVLIPGIVEGPDTRNPYGWGGNTAIVTQDAEVGNLNRFFDSDAPPPEVMAVRDLLDKEQPGLCLDLHEGFSTGFSLFLPPEPSRDALQLARVMTDAVGEKYDLTATSSLLPIWGEAARRIKELAPGIFTIYHRVGDAGGDRSSCGGYASSYGVSITTEPGMDGNLGDRIAMLVRGCEAVIQRFHEMHTGGE